MKIENLLDTKNLISRIDEGMITFQEHPTLPLRVYNYTHEAQQVPPLEWDREMSLCRGLIVDDKGLVVARPFPKFWNYGQTGAAELKGIPEVTEKLDGSLGIYWCYKGERGIATRGSFTSEQALWATEWFRKNLGYLSWPDPLMTPLFEIIYGKNQIVVKYPFEGLVLLSFIDIETGLEPPYSVIESTANHQKIPVVSKFNKTIAECLAEDKTNKEGYVLTWKPMSLPALRVKVKFAEYVRLHKLLTGVSPKAIWEVLAKDRLEGLMKMTEGTPMEFNMWVDKWTRRMQADKRDIETRAIRVYLEFICSLDIKLSDRLSEREMRKMAAAHFTKFTDLAPILFRIWDGDSYEDILWKMVKPKGTDTFKRDEG